VEAIAALRRIRLTGPEIAEILEMATSTVSAVLKRIGLGRLSRLDPPEPARRYERSRAGELIHIDVKKLGRIGPHGAGHRMLGRGWARAGARRADAAGVPRSRTAWDRVHVCIDDATRLAYVEVLPDEKATTAVQEVVGSSLEPAHSPPHAGSRRFVSNLRVARISPEVLKAKSRSRRHRSPRPRAAP
jgi:hypothetical protein